MIRGSRRLGFAESTLRVFGFSVGSLLWSKRMLFLALLSAVPVVIALVARVAEARGTPLPLTGGESLVGTGLFGTMVWAAYVRFIVPVFGVFLGTGLIADEVEDRTITYLFTRPIPRGSVLIGKYLAYLVCTTSVVLPSLMLTYFALVPLSAVAASFSQLMLDFGIVVVGLATYGALFGLVGVVVRRSIVAGLVFVFGWEPLVLLLPGYLKRASVAFYVQSLVPHAVPRSEATFLPQLVVREVMAPGSAVLWLCVVLAVCLSLAVRAVGRRDYVLDQ
jgi:ABC-2 type transport system permease protein